MLLYYDALVVFDVEKEIERSREKLPRGIALTDRSVEFNEVRILPYAFIDVSCKCRSTTIYDRANELCHARLLFVTPFRNHPVKTLRENSLEATARR